MWGYFEYHGGVQYCGDIMSTMGDTQYCGEYHDTCGGYHEYCGGVQYSGGYHLSTMVDIMIHVGNIMIFPMVLSIPMVLKIAPTVLMISPWY